MADAWLEGEFITDTEHDWLVNSISYPLSMIDKITPRPDARVTEQLEADGLEGIRPFMTEKGTYAAAFVNTCLLYTSSKIKAGRPAERRRLSATPDTRPLWASAWGREAPSARSFCIWAAA